MESKITLGKLISLLLTDGGLYKPRSTIYFSSSSLQLIETFKEICRELGIQKFVERERKGGIFVQCYSSKLCKKLLEFSPTYRTKCCDETPLCSDKTCEPIMIDGKRYPSVKIPEFMVSSKRDEIKEYLKLMFSTDGCASLSVSLHSGKFRISRKVTLTTKHPILRQRVLDMIRKVGIDAKIAGYDIQIKGKEELEKFQREISFVPGVEVTKKSKQWFAFDKSEILRKILISYKVPKQSDGFWSSFDSREKIYQFLHSI
jgi:hypothetical protein